MGAFSEGLKAGTALGSAIRDRRENNRRQKIKEGLAQQEELRKQTEAQIDNANKKLDGLTKTFALKIPGVNNRKTALWNEPGGFRDVVKSLSGVDLPEIGDWDDEFTDMAGDIRQITKTNLPESEKLQLVNQRILSATGEIDQFQKQNQARFSQLTPNRQREEQLTPFEQRAAALIGAKIRLSPKEELELALKQKELGFKEEEARRKVDSADLGGKSVFEATQSLRKEYVRQAAAFVDVRDGFARIEAAADLGTAIGQQAIIFGYMKMLDPRSTVRESEVASVENARGVPDSLRNMWNKTVKGEVLTQSQVLDVREAAQELFARQNAQQDEREAFFRGEATKFKLDPDSVAINLDDPLFKREKVIRKKQGPEKPEKSRADKARSFLDQLLDTTSEE